MNCASCSAEILEAAKFCHVCGQKAGTDRRVEPVAHGAPLEDADRRVVTVLFAEVSGVTSVGKRLDPEAMQGIVNHFFRGLIEPVYRYGGVVDKYIDDSVMALFGAPLSHGNDVERAVRAAWEMTVTAERLLRELEAAADLTLSVQIGLNTGLVVAGIVGGAERTDYTVLGDTVNLAQRMKAHASPGTVLAAKATYEAARGVGEFARLEPIKVKGKANLVEAYQLTGLKERTTDLEGAVSDFLAGRDSELTRLHDCWKRTQGGRPQVVVVTGEVGTGKSALVRRFARDVEAEGSRMHSAVPLPYDQQTPYSLAGTMLLSLLGMSAATGKTQALEELAVRVAAFFPDWEYRCALLAHLLGYFEGSPDDMQLSPRQVRTGAFMALNDLILAHARRGPLLLGIEDLHWADPASLEWLTSLVERVAAAQERDIPLLILCQARPEINFERAQADAIDTTTIVLRPLSRPDSASLLAYHLGSTPDALPAPVRHALESALDLAEGNPFYLSELARAMVQSGYIVRDGASWVVDPNNRRWREPDSIHGAVVARLDLLPGHLRKWVQMSSVLGRRFDVRTLAEVAGEDPALAVAELAGQNIFFSALSGEVGFCQGLIQEVAYANLLYSLRRRLHQRAGEVLEVGATGKPPAPPALLAHHYAKAECAAKAARYLFLAGERARSAFANGEAREFLREALEWAAKVEKAGDMPARDEILLCLALVEITMGNLDAAAALLDARALIAEPSARTYRARGELHARRGNLAPAMESFQAAAEMAAADPLERARALASQGNIRRRMSQFKEAIALSEEARVLLEDLDQPAEAAYAHGLMGICFARLGEPERAMAEHSRALGLREKVGDIEGVANSLVNLGIGAANLGDWPASRTHYTRALEIFRKIADKPSIAMTLNNLGDLLLKQGDAAQAERHFVESLRVARRLGDSVETVTALGNLAEALLVRGAAQEALEHVNECLLLTRKTGFSEFADEIAHLRGRALLATGDLRSARAELDTAHRLAEAAGNTVVQGAVIRTMALMAGSNPEALMLARNSETLLRPTGAKVELARTLAVLAKVAPGAEAAVSRKEAMELFTALGAARELAALEVVSVESLDVALGHERKKVQ